MFAFFNFFISLTRSGNRVIIMSIHQPRYSIYKQFDSLTLLSQGNMVYHGDIKETLQYFSGLGEGERERGGKERKRGRQRGTRFVHVKFQDNVFIYFYYFISGYICEEHDNPADFLLDVINQCEGQTSATAGNTAVYPQYLT